MPIQNILQEPLHPIPTFDEPFSHIIIDCLGPLPKTKSQNEYLLTVMCSSTRFPGAIPLSSIKRKQYLVCGHTVRRPLLLLKENWLDEDPEKISVLKYVATFKDRLLRAGKMAKKIFRSAKAK